MKKYFAGLALVITTMVVAVTAGAKQVAPLEISTPSTAIETTSTEPPTTSTTLPTTTTIKQIPVIARTVPVVPANPWANQVLAGNMFRESVWHGDPIEWQCVVNIWSHESGFQAVDGNPSHSYGIPQANPGYKMATAGADWRTNPATQIKWGFDYIARTYKTPCLAWYHWIHTPSAYQDKAGNWHGGTY